MEKITIDLQKYDVIISKISHNDIEISVHEGSIYYVRSISVDEAKKLVKMLNSFIVGHLSDLNTQATPPTTK